MIRSAKTVHQFPQQLDLPGFYDEPNNDDTGIEECGVPHEVSRLAKGELHVHLNGLVPSSTIQLVLSNEGTQLPHGFNPNRDLIRQTACASLATYLAPWQVLRRIPKREDSLEMMVDSAFKHLAANSIRFVELRSSILYLATLQNCSVAEAMQRLISSTAVAATKYSVRRAMVLTVTRGDYSSVQLETLLGAYQSLGQPADVVGLDLAGDEEISYPDDLPSLFREAKQQYGLGVTIHAGETGRSENILFALEQFDADRIGHGTAAGKNPWLMDLLYKRDICVEVCPVSNRLTGAVSEFDAHPIQEFRKHGVPFVICSDNPGIHQKGLNHDYVVASNEGVTLPELQSQFATAKRYSFIKDLE